MSELAVFFKQNKPQRKHEFYAASKDFIDENGDPIKWELKPLTSLELGRIRTSCMTIQAKGKSFKFDSDLYNRMLAAESIVFPNLKSAELQDNYMSEFAPEDRTPENLICLMIDRDDEFQALVAKVNEMNGFSITDNKEDSKVEIAKN